MTEFSYAGRRPRTWRRAALAAVLMAGTALGGFAAGQSGFAATEPAAGTTTGTSTGTPANPPGTSVANPLPDFSGLVTQVKPAVVSITTKLQQSEAEEGQMQQLPLPFRQFPFGGMGPIHRPPPGAPRFGRPTCTAR